MDEKLVDFINDLDCITIFMDKKYGNVFESFRLKPVKEQTVLVKRDLSLSEDWEGYVNTDIYPPSLYLVKLNGEILVPVVKLEIPLEYKIVPIQTPIGNVRIEFGFHYQYLPKKDKEN